MNLVKKWLKNQRGFSLVEVTIAMALLGIAGLAVMNLSDNINTNTRRAEAMVSKTQFASALGQYLNSALGCQELVDKNWKFSTPPNPPVELFLENWKIAGIPRVESQVGFKQFILKSLTASTIVNASMPKVTVGGQTLVKTVVNIQATILVPNKPFQFQKGQPFPPGKEYPYFYSLPVLAALDGTVKLCSDQKNLNETCAAMKGTIDPATGLCEVNAACKLTGTFMQTTCVPAGYACQYNEGPDRPNPYTGGFSCPKGVAVKTGEKSWTHSASCGKKCTQTVTNTVEWNSCLECP